MTSTAAGPATFRRESFIAEHGLWDDAQNEAAERLQNEVERRELRAVRITWADQHGLLRGKTATVPEFQQALRDGKVFQLAPMIMDTANQPSVSPFGPESSFGVPELLGFPDGVLVPDPTTFRVLPWAAGVGWVLSDLYMRHGERVPFCTRGVLAAQLEQLRQADYEFHAGLEIEFCVTRLEDARRSPEESGHPPEPPIVSALAHGYQYLSDDRLDEVDEVARLLADTAEDLGLPLATTELEWGPGQFEFTFSVTSGLASADDMTLFRSAVKQVCRRHGLHATFMPRPALANFNPNGWHLHQSLWRDGVNAFADPADPVGLSGEGRCFLGGLITHAREASLLASPTINAYKRFEPGSFAPWTVCWTKETRGSFVRVCGDGGPETRIENRVGDSAANPYLYLASQIACGLEGLERQLDPGPATEDPTASDRERLPSSLMVALEEFEASEVLRRRLGGLFVDYLATIKRNEVKRFLAHVTDWEQREYFELF